MKQDKQGSMGHDHHNHQDHHEHGHDGKAEKDCCKSGGEGKSCENCKHNSEGHEHSEHNCEHCKHEGHQGHNHAGHHNHEEHANQNESSMAHSGHEQMNHEHMNHDHSNHDHAGHDHAGHDHSGHDHSGHSGHDHSHHDPKIFKRLFWISLILTIPAVIYSSTVQELLGFTPPSFPLSSYLPAILGTILMIVGGRIFLVGGVSELKQKQPGMMALIGLALIVAFGYSALVTILHLFGIMWMGMDFWWELATLITIMLLGHWIEMASIARASGALGELAKLIPDMAERVIGESVEKVKVSELRVGDRVLIRPGASIPADGVVIEGSSSIDESMLTGESKPVEKSEGDAVVAGSINGSSNQLGKGSLTIEVKAVGESTVLAGVVKLVAEAEKSKSKTQLLADRAAGWLFYLALGSAIITLIAWLVVGVPTPDFLLEKVVTVLVIACPHALGLAIPLVSSITSALGASRGLIIRDKRTFEAARKLDIILFDKTGTLTTATRSVLEINSVTGATIQKPKEILKLALALEKNSEHSLARAVIEKAAAEGVKAKPATAVEFIPGVGVSGEIDGKNAMIGSATLLNQYSIKIGPQELMTVDAANKQGSTVIFVVLDGQLQGYLVIGDEIRDTSKAAIDELRALGKPVAIVSGDAEGVVEKVAAELGISEYYAELLPEGKIEIVKKLQSEGLRVGFVGDGVNDAPALAQADVGMAIGAGTDVAIASAGIILVSSDPSAVADVVRLAKRSHAKMIQNLWWAAGYNILAIPLAAGVLYGIGVVLTPAVGAVLMSLSTLIVAANAQLLRRK